MSMKIDHQSEGTLKQNGIHYSRIRNPFTLDGERPKGGGDIAGQSDSQKGDAPGRTAKDGTMVRRERMDSEPSSVDSGFGSNEMNGKQSDTQRDVLDGNGNIDSVNVTHVYENLKYQKCHINLNQGRTDLNGNVSKVFERSRSDENAKCISPCQATITFCDYKCAKDNIPVIESDTEDKKLVTLNTLYGEESETESVKEIEIEPNKSNINIERKRPSIDKVLVRRTTNGKYSPNLTLELNEEGFATHRKRQSCPYESENESISSIISTKTIRSNKNYEAKPLLQSNIGNASEYGDSRLSAQADNIGNINRARWRETGERSCSIADSNDFLLGTRNEPDNVFPLQTDAEAPKNNAQQSDNGVPSCCSTSELGQNQQSEISVQPRPTFITARQEQHSRLIDLSHDDLEDHSKHSLTVNLDTNEQNKEVCIPLPLINTEDGLDTQFDDEDDTITPICCGVCSVRYAELHSRIDAITKDYQWVAKKLEETLSSTRDLQVFKSRATKVAVLTVTVTLSIVCVSAATVIVRDRLGDSGSAYQVFGRNVTTWIADLQEQYVSVSDMVNDLMTRSKSVIHLTNGGRMAKHDGHYFVRWVANENHGQGSLALSKAGDSIMVPTGGYYRISAKMHYKATVENITNIKLEYDLMQNTGGSLVHVRHAVREFPSASGLLQYELQLDTTLYVYPQDAILVSVRHDQMRYLANFDSAHEFTMLEVG